MDGNRHQECERKGNGARTAFKDWGGRTLKERGKDEETGVTTRKKWRKRDWKKRGLPGQTRAGGKARQEHLKVKDNNLLTKRRDCKKR